ncbi:MAG: YggT family protein [Comamonadaceae bacterium]|nr:YggT family protein [Comamonadaceae bacterium]
MIETVRLFVFLMIGVVLISAVMSWVNPYSPFAPLFNALARPFLRPLQRVIPPISNIDLSPLVLLLLFADRADVAGDAARRRRSFHRLMDGSDSWCRVDADGVVRLAVHVQPGASRTGIAGRHGDALKIRLSALAVGRQGQCLSGRIRRGVAGGFARQRGTGERRKQPAQAAEGQRSEAAALGALRQAVQTV